MYIIKLDATDSTNNYLKTLIAKQAPKDFTVVIAEHQTEGRGQMGTIWQTEPEKNLTFSVFKDICYLDIDKQFNLSMVTALAVIDALNYFNIPKLRIKWPNDILAEHKKIGGILIENIIKNNELQGSIIGLGINVNQRFFKNLPQATSMYALKGGVFNRDEVFQTVLKRLKIYLSKLETGGFEAIQNAYEALLFRIHKPSTFEMSSGETFMGFIKGVTTEGKLKVTIEDNIKKAFDLKEVKLLY